MEPPDFLQPESARGSTPPMLDDVADWDDLLAVEREAT